MPSFSSAARLLPALLVALLLSLLQLQGASDFSFSDAVAVAALAYVVLASGRLLLQAASAQDLGPAAACALGILASSLGIYALAASLGITAAWAFGLVAALVAAWDIAHRRRSQSMPNDRRALFGFALCVLFTALWCWGPAGAYELLRNEGFLPVWSDYYFHGGLISQFGDVRALGRGSIYLADVAPSFYHFASYALSAALAGMQDEPGLPLATAAWLPLGFLAMLAGAHALGTRLAGAAGGIAALCAVALIPDASNYGLRNGWFSFHFTLVAHAGATYAVAAACLSLAFLDRWASERSRAALAASAALAVLTVFFRLHIFLLYLPAWMATVALCVSPAARRQRVGWFTIAALSIGVAAAGLGLHALAEHGLGHWRLGGAALGRFLTVVHEWQGPTAYDGLYRDLVDYWPPYIALVVGVGLAVLAALGLLLVALPLAATLAARAGVTRSIDVVCAFLLYCWLLLALFAPTPWHGEASDLIHRPFVLAYALCAIWTACLLVRTFPGSGKRLWWILAGAAVAALPWLAASAPQQLRPKFSWGALDAAAPVPRGLADVARYVRRHASTRDTFAAAGLTAGYATFDLATQLASLSGLPAYLSRPYLEMIKAPPRRELVQARLDALQRIESMADYSGAVQALRHLNIDWYVVAGSAGPRWDPARARAAFTAGSVALYRIP